MIHPPLDISICQIKLKKVIPYLIQTEVDFELADWLGKLYSQ